MQVASLVVPVLDIAVEVLARTKDIDDAKVVTFKDVDVWNVFEPRQDELSKATDLEEDLVDSFILQEDPLLFLELVWFEKRTHPQDERYRFVPEKDNFCVPLLVNVEGELGP